MGQPEGNEPHDYDDDATDELGYLLENYVRRVQNNDVVEHDLQFCKWDSGRNLMGTLRDWFSCVLRIYSYLSFATKKAELGKLSRQYFSLKDIHDVIHDYGGGTIRRFGFIISWGDILLSLRWSGRGITYR